MADTMLGTKDIWVLGLGGKKYVQRFLGKSFIKHFFKFKKKFFFNLSSKRMKVKLLSIGEVQANLWGRKECPNYIKKKSLDYIKYKKL